MEFTNRLNETVRMIENDERITPKQASELFWIHIKHHEKQILNLQDYDETPDPVTTQEEYDVLFDNIKVIWNRHIQERRLENTSEAVKSCMPGYAYLHMFALIKPALFRRSYNI